MLNWIAWNRTVLAIKLYLRQTVLFEIEMFWHIAVCKQKLFLILNWIVWNRTVWLNWIALNRNVFDS